MKTRLVWIFCAILILFFHTNCGNALAANEQRQVVILFAEGLSFSDLEKLKRLPPVDKWIGEAAAGALSIRTPGPRTAANGYLLMGSGTQALYTERSGTAYHPQEALSPKETAGERMQELGGYQAQDLARSAIVFPGIFRLHEDNRDKPYSSRLGLLGTTLAAHKIRVASYGNGDVAEVRQRHAVLFAMDQEGRVPAGDVSGKNTLPAQGYPYGVKTNYDYLREQIQADRTSGLIAVQLSDLSRLYQLGPDMEPGQFARQYQRVLHDLAQFLDGLLSVRGQNQLVMLVSPAVNPTAAKEKALLLPLLSWSGEGKGLLTSATTRQSGLVSGLDVLPTVLSWLDLPVPKGLAGHVMHSVEGGTLPLLLHQVENIHHTYATRSSVLYTYVMLQIVTLAFAALLWLWGRRKEGAGLSRLRRGVRLALLALLWFPCLLLAESLLDWRVHGSVVLGAIIMAGLAAAFWQENHSFARITLTTSAVTVAALLLDGWSGATLMRQSFLGYDPVIGARFYGLGNEYEGVLIGGTIMLIASLYQLYREKSRTLPGTSLLVPAVSVAICAVVLYYMVAPDLGTDAGGFLAGLVGFFVAFSRLHGWRIGKKGLLLLAGGLMLGVIGLMAVSLVSEKPPTHVGRVAQQMVAGEWADVWQMVERKLAMNLRLIRVSIWSKVFAVSLIVLGLLALKNDRFLRHLAQDTPYLVNGFAGVIAGALAGLALNDSGIVTAATCISFLVVPALYAALSEPTQERCST
ncbi:hypothetical protein EDM57_14605 [Brevibacillus gelatini]|uniref:Phosphoglyceromutase n=1 Tax=Brevibacillus gelatini TaxID=1655277 RepID=A0A3M8AWW9_9BACL|nr:hypothetical protein [Brevibacillus gelatini]RNB55721.1 hypothetical protein EDM57_14605 [Brevibacillus gelatini]